MIEKIKEILYPECYGIGYYCHCPNIPPAWSSCAGCQDKAQHIRQLAEVECQARVDKLFTQIAEHIDLTGSWWENLKKREGVSDEDSGD